MSIIFRKINENDYSKIVDLYNTYFETKIDSDDRKNFYDLNPLIKSNPQKFCKGFVATIGNKIVGHIASIPITFKILNKEFSAYSTNSLIVDNNYRLIAPILCKKFADLKDVDLLVNLTASKDASILFNKIGFKTFNKKENKTSNYLLLNNQYLLYNLKIKINLTNLTYFILSYFYLFFFNLFNIFCYFRFSLNKIKIKSSNKLNEVNFDFNENNSPNLNFEQINSKDWLLWKYYRHEKNGNFLCLNISEGHKKIAKVILINYPHKNKIRISEIFLLEKISLSKLLIILIIYLKNKKYDLVEYKFNTKIKNLFLKLFTVRKKYLFNPNMYKIINSDKFDNKMKIEFEKFICLFSNGDKIV